MAAITVQAARIARPKNQITHLRVRVDRDLAAVGGPSLPGGGVVLTVPVTAVGESIQLPAVVLYSTHDAPLGNLAYGAQYTAELLAGSTVVEYLHEFAVGRNNVVGFGSFRLLIPNTATTWNEIDESNDRLRQSRFQVTGLADLLQLGVSPRRIASVQTILGERSDPQTDNISLLFGNADLPPGIRWSRQAALLEFSHDGRIWAALGSGGGGGGGPVSVNTPLTGNGLAGTPLGIDFSLMTAADYADFESSLTISGITDTVDAGTLIGGDGTGLLYQWQLASTLVPFGGSGNGWAADARFNFTSVNGRLRAPEFVSTAAPTFTGSVMLAGFDTSSNQRIGYFGAPQDFVLVGTGTGAVRGKELIAGANITITHNLNDITIAATGGGGGGGGTVTSVGLALPSIFNVSGSPVTGAGTLTGALANQNPNTVFAGPVSGGFAAPTFRSLVPADLPVAARPAVTVVALSGSGVLAPATDQVLLVSTASGNATIVLNTPTTPSRYTIKKTTGDANQITLAPGGPTIDGASTHSFNEAYGSRDVVWDGANWWIV